MRTLTDTQRGHLQSPNRSTHLRVEVDRTGSGNWINLNDLDGIDWVILGGESGPRARPMEESWVIEIRDQCVESEVPFFFKQWGGVNKKKAGRILDGRIWDEVPEASLKVA